MAKVEDRNIDDIISGINNIREQFGDILKGSSPSDISDAEREPARPRQDDASLALEEYLASRLQQIGEVDAETKEIKGLKTGNGWDPANVTEYVYRIDPISIRKAVEVAVASNRSLKDRLRNLFTLRKQPIRVVGNPVVDFVPVWKVKGFHECYYLRTNSYRVNVKGDVVGVEVEGRARDLMLERKHRRFIPSLIADRLQKLAFLTSESKYFMISDVLELASSKSQSELAITGLGKVLAPEDDEAITSWRTKRIFDTSDIKVRGARVQVRDCTITKDMVIDKFREKVVRMPERFKQILSNRLQISELKRIYVPFIRISIQKDLVPHEVIINGTTGDIANTEILQLLEL